MRNVTARQWSAIDLVAEALCLERLGIVAEDAAQRCMDRREEVGVVVRQSRPGGREASRSRPSPVSTLGNGNGSRVPSAELVELHEDQVPDLEPARALLGVIGDAVGTLGELGAAVVVDLAAGPAGARLGHPPEVLVVAVARRRPSAPSARAAGRSRRARSPRRPRRRSRSVAARRSPGIPSSTRQELPGPVDRLALEVVAEAPVAQHLEQGVVARRAPHLLEVVVLAGDAQAALDVDGAGVGCASRRR